MREISEGDLIEAERVLCAGGCQAGQHDRQCPAWPLVVRERVARALVERGEAASAPVRVEAPKAPRQRVQRVETSVEGGDAQK